MSAIENAKQVVGLPTWRFTHKLPTSAQMSAPLVVLFMLVLIARQAHAAPIPLVEFTHVGFAFRAGPAPPTVPLGFGRAPNPSFFWEDNYGPHDVGMTFSAPAAVIEGANDVIHSPTPGFFR